MLFEHHATPLEQKRRIQLCFPTRMGKKGQGEWKGATWQRQSGSQQQSWSYWDGSWKNRQPRQQNQFPDYGQTQIDVWNGATEQQHPEEGESEQDQQGLSVYMKELQKALTACRKSDGKLRKLQENKQLKERQWLQYQADLKKKYVEQNRAFNKDMESYAQEMAQAMAASKAAVDRVQELAAGGVGASRPMEQDFPLTTQAEEDAWQDLMQGPDASGSSAVAQDDLLARALREAHSLSSHAVAIQQAVQASPLSRWC